jgi:Transposase DDE domain group 1
MRLKVSGLRQVVRRNLGIEFGREQLTSYGGLELVRQYFEIISLNRRIRQGFREHGLGGDYGCVHLVVLVVGLLMVGARRLKQLRYVANDPLFARLCGLARIPADRTVVKWLKEFTRASLGALVRINSELLYDQIQQLGLRRLTIDIDGTVIRTGNKVAWAMHGFNPHHPKDPSYYPLLAHLAQTGQILRLKNRPGNVHDSKGAEAFMRELIDELRARFGRSVILEFRMDAAFFQENILKLLDRRGCFYAIKLPFCQWTGVRAAVAAQLHWLAVQPQITCFETQLRLKVWELQLHVVVFRKRVAHHSRRNYQLDLSPPMMATSSTRRSPLTSRSARAHCGTLSLAAGRRKKPLLSSRENSRWTPSLPTITPPTAHGSSCRFWPITSLSAFSSTPTLPRPNRTPPNAPIATGW